MEKKFVKNSNSRSMPDSAREIAICTANSLINVQSTGLPDADCSAENPGAKFCAE